MNPTTLSPRSAQCGLDIPPAARALLVALRDKRAVRVEVHPLNSIGAGVMLIDLLDGPHGWCAIARHTRGLSDGLRGYAQAPVLRGAVLASIDDRVSNTLLEAENHDTLARRTKLQARRAHESSCAKKLREEAEVLTTLLGSLAAAWPEEAP